MTDLDATPGVSGVRELRAQAAQLHAHVVDDSAGDWHTYQCVAPTGHVWRASFTHLLCVTWQGAAERAPAVRDAVERMRLGTAPCDVEHCDVCEERADHDHAKDTHGS
jgi:hypothetical protein